MPPQTTRARLRGEFIRQANLKGKDYRVDWVYLKLNDPERETILCKDPFQSHDERVERLIRSFWSPLSSRTLVRGAVDAGICTREQLRGSTHHREWPATKVDSV